MTQSEDQNGPAARGRSRTVIGGRWTDTLGWHLMMPIAAVAVPLIAISAGMIWSQFKAERATAAVQLVANARALSLLVDREFSRTRVVGELLARSPARARGDRAAFQAEMRAATDLLAAGLPNDTDEPRANWRDADGRVLVTTADDVPVGPPNMPAHFQEALRTGRPVISDLFISRRTGLPRVSIAIPVPASNAAPMPLSGLIGVTVPRERLLAIVREAGLPPGAVASILDRRGVTVARSDRDAQHLGAPPVPAIPQAIALASDGILPPGTLTLDHQPATIAFARAPASGFVVEIDMQDGQFVGPLRAMLTRVAAIDVTAVAGGLLLAWFASRRVISAFQAVPANAALAAATDGSAVIPKLREARDLANLLAGAFAEQRVTEATLREVLEQQRLFIEKAPVGIAVFDDQMRYLAASRRFLQDYHLPFDDPTDLVGQSHYAVFPAQDARRRALHRRALAGETIGVEEDEFIHGNAGSEWVHWEMTPWMRPNGTVGGVILFAELITERKTAERKLRDNERRLSQIVESSSNAILITSIDGAIELFNHRAEIVFGYTRDEMLGRTIDVLIPERLRQSHASYHRAFSADPRTRPMGGGQALVGRRKDGSEVALEIGLGVIDAEDGVRVLVTVVDITERQRQEEALLRSEEQLRQAQKMEAIGNLTGGMAHDFNNLLGVIIGNLDLAEPKLDPESAEFVHQALEAALRGADLTRDLLAFARRQPLQPRPVSLNDLVRDIARLLGRTLGEDIRIVLALAPDLWPVIADPVQVEAALANLANNARDAMKSGGWLTFVTGNRRIDADYVAVYQDVTEGDYAMIEVSDTGTGMSPEVAARIFEPFFTTKDPDKGTGLGLSMVFGFMKQSGGHINVFTEPGAGTTFRLFLPRSETEPSGVKRTAEPAGARAAGETVLVVEDKEALRRLVVRQLRGLGYRAIEAQDAFEALGLLETRDVEVLFSDIVMPGGMDGFELARQVRARWPRIRIILTSGFPDHRPSGEPGQPALVERILMKPYRRHDLAEALRDALGA